MWRTRKERGIREQISSGRALRMEEAVASTEIVERSRPLGPTELFLTLCEVLIYVLGNLVCSKWKRMYCVPILNL